jgi:hypothetical protein
MSLAITQRGLLDAPSSKARQFNESNQDCKSQINPRAWSRSFDSYPILSIARTSPKRNENGAPRPNSKDPALVHRLDPRAVLTLDS